MTPDRIFRVASTRTNVIRMLERGGYITGQQTPGGNIFGNRPEGFGALGKGGKAASARDAAVNAREAGVRDPLNRYTMTSAERRLYDANYRYEYAARNGTVHRSIGANSADMYTVERPVSPAVLAEMKDQRDRLLASARSSSSPSMHRLADALNSAAGGGGRGGRDGRGPSGLASGGGELPESPDGRKFARSDLPPHSAESYEHAIEKHAPGVGARGKTEFPWKDSDEIVAAIADVVDNGLPSWRGNFMVFSGTHRGYEIEVLFDSYSGRLRFYSGYPLVQSGPKGGKAIKRNR